jgi:hypothetical protein
MRVTAKTSSALRRPGALRLNEMSPPLKIGTVLVQSNTLIPDSVYVQRKTFFSDWQAITNLNGDDLDRQLRSNGWNFIFVAGARRGTAWGSWSENAVCRAAIRVLNKTHATTLNAFEITGIHARRFLGMPYVIVTGHSRHVQKTMVLQDIAQRIHQAAHTLQRAASDGVSVTTLSAPVVAK